MVKVTWSVPYQTQFGQNVVIVGSHQKVGSWEPNRGLELKWTDGHVWVGEAAFPPG